MFVKKSGWEEPGVSELGSQGEKRKEKKKTLPVQRHGLEEGVRTTEISTEDF